MNNGSNGEKSDSELSGGYGVGPPFLVFGKNWRRNHRRNKSRQGEQDKIVRLRLNVLLYIYIDLIYYMILNILHVVFKLLVDSNRPI